MDKHRGIPGLTGDAVAGAHQRDLEVGERLDVKYLKYWFNEKSGDVFSDEITEVKEDVQ